MSPDDEPTQGNAPMVEAAGDGAVSRDGATSQLILISRAMVRIYKEQFGRGPDRVRSFYAGPDAIVCFLEDTLTPVERSLATLDEHQRLRDMRMLFQYVAEDQFRGAVEEITGRKVTAFISGIDTRADVASELFTLEPRSLDGAAQQQ